MTEQFKKLSDYQHARQRTEMYLGSRETHTQSVLCFDGTEVSLKQLTWVPSLYTAWRELVDNALDEMVAHGHGDTLKVSYDPKTMEIEVEDNGRGLPLDEKSELGKGPAASILLGEARAGRNFDERGQVAGVNGLGAAIVNFTAEWFVLDVWRDDQRFHQRWTEGTYRKQEIHKTDGPTLNNGAKGKSGTRVKFKPSAKVWKILAQEESIRTPLALPLEFIESRMWDIALANPKLKVWFNGERLTVGTQRDTVVGVLFAQQRAALIETRSERVHSRFYAVTGLTDEEHIHSLVNNIPVLNGGPHVDEFRSLFYTSLINKLDAHVKKELKIKGRSDNILTRADVAQGIMIYNITRMDDPHFDSQTKSRLVSEIKPDIRKGFMESDVAGFIRRNPEWVAQVVDRCRSRTQKSQSKELQKTQKALEKTKVASLKDATGKDRRKCTLFIAEGESAISGMMSVRDATIHGGIGLRGKIMNVHGVTPKKALESKALTDIMSSIGLKIGETANRMHLRYGKVFIATDEDEDGKNITALIINFLYKWWPELFQGEPFVYKFSTPLIILVKGKQRHYVYADDYDQFNPDDWKGWQIIRAKGLARLTQDDWKEAINKPKLIPMVDDGNLGETLDLIFNNARADDRKQWLSE